MSVYVVDGGVEVGYLVSPAALRKGVVSSAESLPAALEAANGTYHTRRVVGTNTLHCKS